MSPLHSQPLCYRRVAADRTVSPPSQVVETARSLPRGDFPDVETYRRWLLQPGMDFNTMQILQPNMLERLDTVLAVEIPKLLALLPDAKFTTADDLPVVSLGPGEGCVSPERLFSPAAVAVALCTALRVRLSWHLVPACILCRWEECEEDKADSMRWQLDESAVDCPLCAKSFGMTRRRTHSSGAVSAPPCVLLRVLRVGQGPLGFGVWFLHPAADPCWLTGHHCRKCGGVFCDACTIVPKVRRLNALPRRCALDAHGCATRNSN